MSKMLAPHSLIYSWVFRPLLKPQEVKKNKQTKKEVKHSAICLAKLESNFSGKASKI